MLKKLSGWYRIFIICAVIHFITVCILVSDSALRDHSGYASPIIAAHVVVYGVIPIIGVFLSVLIVRWVIGWVIEGFRKEK